MSEAWFKSAPIGAISASATGRQRGHAIPCRLHGTQKAESAAPQPGDGRGLRGLPKADIRPGQAPVSTVM